VSGVSVEEDVAVATVAGRPIPRSRLLARIADVRRGPRGRQLPPEGATDDGELARWMVQELVTEEVLAHEARALGLGAPESADGVVPDAWPAAIEGLMARVTGSVAVPEDEVRAYYDRNGDRYRRPAARRVRHVLLADEASAHEVAAAVARGADLAVIAGTRSLDAGTRAAGGDLGEVHPGELSGPFEDAVFAAEAGTLIGPIRTDHGWHVARVEAVADASDVPFAEARPQIQAELTTAARIREFDAWLARRRAELAVIAPGFEHPADPVGGFPSHRH
jgi:[acyl-carrier-protein] S-malonyltransferase